MSVVHQEELCQTHDRPQDALELQNQLRVLGLLAILSDEHRKLGEVTFLPKDGTTELCLCQLSIEVRRQKILRQAEM
jgi:hypothetical protein